MDTIVNIAIVINIVIGSVLALSKRHEEANTFFLLAILIVLGRS